MPVVRVRLTPLTLNVDVARMSTSPAVLLVIWIEHCPLAFVTQVFVPAGTKTVPAVSFRG